MAVQDLTLMLLLDVAVQDLTLMLLSDVALMLLMLISDVALATKGYDVAVQDLVSSPTLRFNT